MTGRLSDGLVVAAQDALRADADLRRAFDASPEDDFGEWIAWFDDVYAKSRDARARAVRIFVDHPLYPRAHRDAWGDEFTTGTTADVAWIPVARRLSGEPAATR